MICLGASKQSLACREQHAAEIIEKKAGTCGCQCLWIKQVRKNVGLFDVINRVSLITNVIKC